MRLLLAVALVAVPTGASWPALAQSSLQIDPTGFLPDDDQLPPGFERQLDYDRVVEEPGVVRVVRFYTRGAPDVPSPDHASILLAVDLSATTERAVADFHETISSWSRMGYGLYTLDIDIGDEAVGGWDGFLGESDHPKRGALALVRFGAVVAAVQWVDDPGRVTLEDVVAIERLIEARV